MQMLKRVVRADARPPFSEVNGRQEVDIGEGKSVPGEKGLVGQNAVEHFEAVLETRAAPLNELW